jgi:uncharacterized lipoprotein YehR (DUF1307 family)
MQKLNKIAIGFATLLIGISLTGCGKQASDQSVGNK